MHKLTEKGNLILKVLLCAAGIWAAIRYSAECTAGIANGIRFCASVLVPSLFIFMVLTAYLIKSGAYTLLTPLMKPLGKLFGLPPEGAAAVALGMIGGYPIGAGCVGLMYEEGMLSPSEAEKAAYIAVAAGPGFILNYVGRALLNSPTAGNILLAAQVISVLITGAAAGVFIKCAPPKIRATACGHYAEAFVGSVRSAAGSALSMCATVLLFSAAVEVASAVSDSRAADIIAGFAEVTTGCSRLSASSPLYVTAFIIGFGGLSVHFQIFAALRNVRVRKLLFFLFRIIGGISSAAAAYILLKTVPSELEVFSTTDAPLSPAASATLIGSGALVLLSAGFIGAMREKVNKTYFRGGHFRSSQG